MSYEIVYDRRFIKVNDMFLPLVLSGSNNCYEPTFRGERRERNWCIFGNKVLYSAEELRGMFLSWIGGKYQEHFVYHNKWVDDNALIRFCDNGIKDARTIEEYNKSFSAYIYGKEIKKKTYIRTTKELAEWIAEAENEKQDDEYICLGFCQKEPLKIAKKHNAINGKVIAKYRKQYIVDAAVEKGFSYCKDVTKAKIYESEEEARKQMPEYILNGITFCDAEATLKRFNNKKYVIKNRSYYVYKCTGRSLRYVSYANSAQRFTKQEAEKWIEKYSKYSWNNPVNFEMELLEEVG